MKLNSIVLAGAIIVLLFGGIGFSSVMNWWQTESSKTPARYTEGEAQGEYNPADIRGSYTFGDVSRLFGIPLDDLKTAFRIPADQDLASFGVKDLEAISAGLPVEIGTASVRMFVAFYQGLPFDLISASEETYLFPEAAGVLKAQNRMQPDQLAYLESHLVPESGEIPAVIPGETTSDQAVSPTRSSDQLETATITGRTTFQEMLDAGLSQGTIESILGKPMPDSQTVVKDYATENGLEFSTVKLQFQAAMDRLP